MPKIKFTKTELKNQQDDLRQYRRFLPTLQLKKQQLQLEIRRSQSLLEANERAYAERTSHLDDWVALFGDSMLSLAVAARLRLESVEVGEENIAGVTVPVFKKVSFHEEPYDLFAEEWYLDEAIAAVKDLVSLREAHKVLEEHYRRLHNELLTTTQRVNLFEKVKIPECRENIRAIRIYLSDVSTAEVARGKIAKRKLKESEAAA